MCVDRALCGCVVNSLVHFCWFYSVIKVYICDFQIKIQLSMTANCTGQADGWRTPRSGLLSSSIRMRRPPAHSTATYTFSWMRNWTRSAAYNATAAAAVQAALGHHLWTDWVWKDTICSGWAPAPRLRLLSRCIRSCLHPVSHLEEESHLPRASMALARAPRVSILLHW